MSIAAIIIFSHGKQCHGMNYTIKMYNLNCQSRTWKTIKLFKPLSFSYNNSKRWFTTTFKVTNTYFDHYVNRSDDTTYSYDDKFHRPDGCISLHEFKIRRNKLTSAIIKFHEKSTNISQERNAAHHHLLIILCLKLVDISLKYTNN